MRAVVSVGQHSHQAPPLVGPCSPGCHVHGDGGDHYFRGRLGILFKVLHFFLLQKSESRASPSSSKMGCTPGGCLGIGWQGTDVRGKRRGGAHLQNRSLNKHLPHALRYREERFGKKKKNCVLAKQKFNFMLLRYAHRHETLFHSIGLENKITH